MGSEYNKNKRNLIDEFQAVDPLGFQYVSFNATSTQSSPLDPNTSMVWIFSTTDCWVKFGDNPTAVPGDGTTFRLRSGIYRAFTIIKPSQKIAVIKDVDNGELDIHEGR